MKYLFIAFLFISSISYGQGIEPSSFQPTPYLGGVLRGVTPFVDEFTGQTYYLYVHDSLDAETPYIDTIFMTDFNLYYIKNGDTIYVGSVTDSSFIYNVVSDTFALDMDIDSTNELQELFHQDNILVLTGAGPDSQVDLTTYMNVDTIYMNDYDLWYYNLLESEPYFIGNVTDSSYIKQVVSDSSTVVENDYGTIIVESPAKTFGVTVDSSKYTSIYQNSLKQNLITGTSGQTLRFSGTNTLAANSLLYNDGSSIGVGTTSPQSLLQVQGSGDQFLTTTTTSSSKSGFFFNYNNTAFAGMKIYYNTNDANVYFDNLYPYDGVNNFGDVIWRTTPVTIGSQVTAMTLKGNGRLGLGTALPSQLLHVAGNSRLTGLFYDGNNEAGTAGQVLSSTGAITDWITPVTISDSTNVLNSYGTTITESPANTFNIKVDSSLFATPYDLTQINFIDSTNVLNSYGTTITESPVNTFNIKVDSSLFMTTYDGTLKQDAITGTTGQTLRFSGTNTLAANSILYNDGTYIGINNTSPSYPLHVLGGGLLSTSTFGHTGVNGGINVHNTGTLASGRDAQIRLVNGTSYFGANDRTYQLFNVGESSTAAAFAIQYYNGSSYFERLRLTSSGYLGLATASPSQILDVNGGSRFRGAVYDGSNAVGSSGQVFTSTGSATAWATAPTGSGTTNYLPLWTSSTVLGNSKIYQSGNNVIADLGAFTAPVFGARGTQYPALNVTNPTWPLSSGVTSQFTLTNGTSYFGASDNTVQIVNAYQGGQSEYYYQRWNGTNYKTIYQYFFTDDYTKFPAEVRFTDRTGTATSLGGYSSTGKTVDVALGTGFSFSSGTLNFAETGDISAVTVSAPVTGSSLSGPIPNIGVDTTDATAAALATQFDLLGKQATLVSGTNIKTVNSNSLVGSGNVSVGTVTSITAAAPLTGGAITTSGTIGVDTTATTGSALATQFDISTKVSGSGTDNYIPRFNGTTAIENSIMYDDGTMIGIGNTSPSRTLHVTGEARITDLNTDATPTVIIGADANGVLESLSLSNLSIPGGTILKGTGLTINGSGTRYSGDLDLSYSTGANPTTYPTWTQSSSSLSFRLPYATTGQVLKFDGTGWAAGTDTGGTGTVTSIATGNGITGGTITTTGTLGLTGQALAVHNLNSNGFIVRTSSGNVSARTIVGGTGISVSNGNGVTTDPIITNNGVTQLTGSAPITVSSATGAVTVGLNFGTGLALSGSQLQTTPVIMAFLNHSSGGYTANFTAGETKKVDFTTALSNSSITTDVSTNENITINSAGTYEINYNVCISSPTNFDEPTLSLYINGSQNATTVKSIWLTVAGQKQCISGTHVMALSSTNTVDMRVSHPQAQTGAGIIAPQLKVQKLF